MFICVFNILYCILFLHIVLDIFVMCSCKGVGGLINRNSLGRSVEGVSGLTGSLCVWSNGGRKRHCFKLGFFLHCNFMGQFLEFGNR